MATSTNGNATASASTGGIGFFGLLTIVLLVLKVTGYLNISWLIVFLPVIIAFGLFLLVIIVMLLVAWASVR